LSKSCQKVAKKLPKSCQKVVKKVVKSCQKVPLVILCVTGSHLQNSNKVGGGQIVVPRPSASALLTGRWQKQIASAD
jgi:hypothetical protein